MAHHTVSLRVPADITEQFGELARASGIDSEVLMMSALRDYLDDALEAKRRILQSMAEIERGEFMPVEDIEAEELSWLARHGFTPDQIAALDRQVNEELRAYDRSAPCE